MVCNNVQLLLWTSTCTCCWPTNFLYTTPHSFPLQTAAMAPRVLCLWGPSIWVVRTRQWASSLVRTGQGYGWKGKSPQTAPPSLSTSFPIFGSPFLPICLPLSSSLEPSFQWCSLSFSWRESKSGDIYIIKSTDLASIAILLNDYIYQICVSLYRLVRLTSPNLNLVIAFGVILFNCSVFLFANPSVSDSVLEVFCAVSVCVCVWECVCVCVVPLHSVLWVCVSVCVCVWYLLPL